MVSHGPSLIYDKSTLQGLTERESYWLHQHFHCVLAPPIYGEVLADLKKEPRKGKSAEQEVATIARKIPSYAFTPSMHYRGLIMEDLMAGPVEMVGRPYRGRARKVKMPDGTHGVFYEESPEAKAFRLWSDGKFNDMEHLLAEEWRLGLSKLDLRHRRQSFSWMLPRLEKLKNDQEVFDFVQMALSVDSYRLLSMALEYFQVPRKFHDEALNRWIRGGGKSLAQHVPYVTHVLKVDMLFTFLLVKGFISDSRPSHHVDFNYLYYLPFCAVFTSNDRLHRKYAPMLLARGQKYVEGSFLKEGLGELVTYYEGLPEEVIAKGSATYAEYPPLDGPRIISDMHDECCGYDWRAAAKASKVPSDPEASKEILKRAREFMALAKEQHPDISS